MMMKPVPGPYKGSAGSRSHRKTCVVGQQNQVRYGNPSKWVPPVTQCRDQEEKEKETRRSIYDQRYDRHLQVARPMMTGDEGNIVCTSSLCRYFATTSTDDPSDARCLQENVLVVKHEPIDSDYINNLKDIMSSFQGSSRTATEKERMKLTFDGLTKTVQSPSTRNLISTRPVLAQTSAARR
jgi:hypothetical protein